ncbi:MAG: twin-arginine translocase TatA/TatE family subunit [Halobacteriota archaeon]|nr:twin-arginine translocase TatA/TatE family subunit [Halobacteriota archaeon]
MAFGGMMGPTEIMLIVAVVFLLFGAKKVPDMARSMGGAMGEFRKAQRESELNLRNFESEVSNRQQQQTVTEETEIQKTAKNLGIDIKGKTDNDLLKEIEGIARIRENAQP